MRKLFLIILGILIFFNGCSREENGQPLNNNQLNVLSYFPQNIGYLLYANIYELRKTEYWKRLFDTRKSNKFSPFTKNAGKIIGINFSKDVEQIYIGGDWNHSIIVGILIDNKKLKVLKHLRNKNEFSSEVIHGKEVFSLRNKNSLHFYLVKNSFLLITNDESYINNSLNKVHNSLTDNKNLLSIINSIRDKNYFWVATDKGIESLNYFKHVLHIKRYIPHQDLLQKIKSMTFSLGLDKEFSIGSDWNAYNSKDAYLITAAIKGAITMNLLSVDNYELAKIIKKTKVKQYDSKINFKLNLTEKDVLVLHKLADKQKISLKL